MPFSFDAILIAINLATLAMLAEVIVKPANGRIRLSAITITGFVIGSLIINIWFYVRNM